MPYDSTNAASAPDESGESLQASWMTKIGDAEKAARRFRDFVKRVNRRLAIDNGEVETRMRGRRLNIAWANLEILKPSAFARPPKVVVATRNDSRDKLVGAAAMLLERATNTNNDLCGVFDALVNLRDDYLRYGRGVAWVRYEGTFEKVATEEAEAPQPDAPAMGHNGGPPMAPRERLKDERVYVDYVSWDKFGHNPAAMWSEVEFVYRMVPMTKGAFAARWPGRAKEVTFGEAKRLDDGGQKAESTTLVIEVWCKESRKVYWLSKQAKTPLEVGPPPIEFKNFWPCPRPAYGTTLDRTLIPKPDLMFYEDQLAEIDDLTKRIGALQQSLKVKGFYSQGASKDGAAAIESAIQSNDDRAFLVPVAGWAAFGDKKDMGIVWLPIDVVANVLTACVTLRKEMIGNVYEVTGISDIMRGHSEASETLGAQQLKSQYGSIRVREKQAEMARVARDCCAMVGEVIGEHFEPETLTAMTQTQVPPEVIALLRNDRMRNFVIDIETDSTIVPDENLEKQRRIEFATTVGGMIQQAAPIAQQSPPLATLVAEVIKYVAQGFRAGRPLEQAIDEAMAGTVQQIQQRASQPPPPDPKMLEVQQRGQIEADRLGFEVKKLDATMALEREKAAKEDARAREQMQREHDFKREGLTSGEMLKREEMERRSRESAEMRANAGDVADFAQGRTAKEAGALVSQMTPAMQAIGEGLAALGSEMRAGMEAQAAATQALAEEIGAEKEVVRDPVSGRAVGARKKPPAMVT